ncbi:hypothetical protein [Halalkalibacter okhensis]|uniref:Uncharacterized protein n=1 Tax=Halalkalibacter okhensis TaxID=333138 RepID=A0A0B0I9D4_9BACI|nr:hypothetical protein [Halalkalibacter okhensis]KHF39143.1 hypothetical protein LQ50_17090 [Halalkalibacter okhensis]
MTKTYKAVTYDVCEHNDLYEDMNEYFIDSPEKIDEKIRELAKQDVAPLVKLYELDTRNEFQLIDEYKFKDYDCGCLSKARP